MSLFFVTSNKDKLREAQAIVPELVQFPCELPEPQELDPQRLIQDKLQSAAGYCNGACVVEDQWLELDSLHGMPGPFIKWFRERMGDEGIYELADKYHDYRAVNKVLLGYRSASGADHYFIAEVAGAIVAPRGTMDFGWGVIFQPNGQQKTYAEMGSEEKQMYNPRANVFNQLRVFLGTHS